MAPGRNGGFDSRRGLGQVVHRVAWDTCSGGRKRARLPACPWLWGSLGILLPKSTSWEGRQEEESGEAWWPLCWPGERGKWHSNQSCSWLWHAFDIMGWTHGHLPKNHEKNTKQTQIEGQFTKYLISTPQNCQSHQKQGKFEKMSFIAQRSLQSCDD